MKRIFKMNLAIMYCLSVLILSSCQEEQLEEKEQPVQFSFGAEDLSKEGRIADIEDIRAIVITVKDASGATVLEMEKIALYNVEGSFISEPVALKPGDYRLTHFMVVDDANNVLYISPKEGSDKAHLVSDPLPIAFHIVDGETTNVGVVVIRVEDAPEAYGYVSFHLDIQEEKVVFKVIAYQAINRPVSSEVILVQTLTEAYLEVYKETSSEENKIYEATITPENNTFEIPDFGSTPIHIKVTKPNNHPYGKTFSRAELEMLRENPLEVVLEMENPFVPIIKAKGGIGPQYIHPGAPNKLLYYDYNNAGIYKIDITDIHNPGDPVLVQKIPGGSFHEDHYGKLFFGSYFSADMGDTWKTVTEERPLTDFVEMNNVNYGLKGRKLYRETGNHQWELVRELPYHGDLTVHNSRMFAGNGLLVSDDGVNFTGTGIAVEEGLGSSFYVLGTFTALDKLFMQFLQGLEIGYLYEWDGSGWLINYDWDYENERLGLLAGAYQDYMVLVEENNLRIFNSCSESSCEPIYEYFFVWQPVQHPTYTIWGTYLNEEYVFMQTVPDDEGYNYLYAADLSKLELK